MHINMGYMYVFKAYVADCGVWAWNVVFVLVYANGAGGGAQRVWDTPAPQLTIIKHPFVDDPYC